MNIRKKVLILITIFIWILFSNVQSSLAFSAWPRNTCVLKKNWNVSCFWNKSFWLADGYNWWDAIWVSNWDYHTCILKNDWNVVCFWENDRWQSKWYNWWDAIKVSAWRIHTCVLKKDWNVSCFWDNSYWAASGYNWWDAIDISVWMINTAVLRKDWTVKMIWYDDYADEVNNRGDIIWVSNRYNKKCVLTKWWNVYCNWFWDKDWTMNKQYLWWDAVNVSLYEEQVCILKKDWNVECIWNKRSDTYPWENQYNDYPWSKPESIDYNFNSKDAVNLSVWRFQVCILTKKLTVVCKWPNYYWEADWYNWWDAILNSWDKNFNVFTWVISH